MKTCTQISVRVSWENKCSYSPGEPQPGYRRAGFSHVNAEVKSSPVLLWLTPPPYKHPLKHRNKAIRILLRICRRESKSPPSVSWGRIWERTIDCIARSGIASTTSASARAPVGWSGQRTTCRTGDTWMAARRCASECDPEAATGDWTSCRKRRTRANACAWARASTTPAWTRNACRSTHRPLPACCRGCGEFACGGKDSRRSRRICRIWNTGTTRRRGPPAPPAPRASRHFQSPPFAGTLRARPKPSALFSISPLCRRCVATCGVYPRWIFLSVPAWPAMLNATVWIPETRRSFRSNRRPLDLHVRLRCQGTVRRVPRCSSRLSNLRSIFRSPHLHRKARYSVPFRHGVASSCIASAVLLLRIRATPRH